MTQIGIGQISHAKPTAKPRFNAHKHNGTDKVAMKQIKRAAKKAATNSDKNEKKEGQLAVEILQTDTEMIIVCPIAGVAKEDIKVAIQDDVLTIRGERKKIEGINANENSGKQAIVRELFWGTFSRSIVLPDHIDRKEIAARVHEHMLVISIPKTEDFKTRIIHINE